MVFGGEVPEALTNRLDGRVGVYEYYPEVPYEDSMSAFGALFILFFLLPIPVISFFRWLLSLLAKKNEEIKLEGYEVKQKAGISYFDSPSLSMVSSVWNKKGFKRFLLYGVSLVAIYIIALYFVPDLFPDASSVAQNDWASGITLFTYLSLVCVVQNRMELKKADALAEGSKVSKAIYKRAKGDAHSVLARVMAPWLGVFYARAFKKRINESSYDCPICGQPMESADPIELPKVWSVEQEIGAYSLSYCRCASGHLLVERAKGPKYSKYAACDKCGAYAVEQTFVKLISAATYTESGSKEVTYSCKCCDNTYTVTQTIPKLVHTSSSSSGYHSHHSSSSHGSFGGGRSGGGGYSGRW